MTKTMIKLEHIHKHFGQGDRLVKAVEDVSLEISEGEIFGIIGFSGAGKSSLVRCINLLERPSLGKVFVNNCELTALSEAELRKSRHEIGFIFQHFNLFPSRTVGENVAFALRHSGLSKQEQQARVAELLDLVGLAAKEEVYPAQLSGGQKQRVAIARALANHPKVLLCDEATSALDPQTTESILKLLKGLRQELGLTIVIITHQMDVVKSICDRAALMERGKIIEEGTVFELFSNPQTQLGKEFIASSSNLQKIYELIEEKHPLVSLKAGEKIVRLSYHRANADEAVISEISRRFNLDVSIIFADIEVLQGSFLGGTVALLSGDEDKIHAALDYLASRKVDIEVICDAASN